jgi:dienelactone hydrolase
MELKITNMKNYLLIFPMIFSTVFSAQSETVTETEIQFQSDNVQFPGKLFIPKGDGPFPAVVILHGGSSNVKAHRATSSYYAWRFAKKGIAALIYDKRGTGDSGGIYSKSTFDDFVNDALNAVKFLKKQKEIDPQKVGILGPSQGGRIAAIAAARSSEVSFIVTFAAPLISIADLMYFSTMDILQYMEIPDSVQQVVEPLWRKHYTCVEKSDKQGLEELDIEIKQLKNTIHDKFLPFKSDQIDHLSDFGRGDFQPQYNSMPNDYISVLSKVQIPWLSIYAEFDKAVPVNNSIKIKKEQLTIAGNTNYEIKIIPNADHGFKDMNTKEYLRIEEIAIEWVLRCKKSADYRL